MRPSKDSRNWLMNVVVACAVVLAATRSARRHPQLAFATACGSSGELQSIYILDRESENVWRYYSIVRTGMNANRMIVGNESSAVNRAVAFYRYFVGIPTDQEPPAAR
jgi:hypothetical protein